MSSTSDPQTPQDKAEPAVCVGQTLELTVEKIAAGGHGLSTIDGLPVFIPGAIPGQTVEVVVTKRKDRFAEATIQKVIRKSMDETPARCKHFTECGGCVWQHLPYEKQILYKEQIVKETLEHVTPIEEKIRKTLSGRVLSIIPSPKVFNYRNKLELSFGGGSKPCIGYHRPEDPANILPIEECHLYDEQLGALLQQVQRFMQETNLPVYNPKTRKGMLRSLLLRRGEHTGEQMLCFVVQARKKQLEPLFQHFVRFGQNPAVTSLLVAEHFGTGPRPDNPRIHVLKGGQCIHERLFDLMFELSPYSFFQTNTLAAEKLYQAIAQASDLSGRETVLDCYCGLGSIGQYISRFCEKVVGVESSQSAVEDALKSAGSNKIGNISFYRGAAEHVLQKQLKAGGKYSFDCIILDPPRIGLHKNVIDSVLCHRPEKIVYVSCNTSTFARDLAEFLKNGYELRMVQPVDLFPHTAHVETVALLQRS